MPLCPSLESQARKTFSGGAGRNVEIVKWFSIFFAPLLL
jgi:hypothetical protein